MRHWIVPFLVFMFACGTAEKPSEPAGPDRWSGTYRYNGVRTELKLDGRFYRFSDARLGRFYFRLTGGFLEDDTRKPPVRVFPNVQDDTSGTDTPYRTLRLSWTDEDMTLIRVP